MTETNLPRSPDQLDQTNYSIDETFSVDLDPHLNYSGIAFVPQHGLALIFNENNEKNLLEIRSIESNSFELKRSLVLKEISSSIDDFCWSDVRKELLIVSDGFLYFYNFDEEKTTEKLRIDDEKNKCRVASNSTLIAVVNSRHLTLFDIKTLKIRREKRLDHVCDDIEFDDEFFLSTHTGKLEFLNRSFFSTRRFAIGGTALCRFNSRLWLIADAFDDRILWQSIDKLVQTIPRVHQPKSIVVLPFSSRIIVFCLDPNRFVIFDPNVFLQ